MDVLLQTWLRLYGFPSFLSRYPQLIHTHGCLTLKPYEPYVSHVPSETEELLTAGDVADIFKVSTVTVGVWADEGKLPSFRTPGGHRRFKRADIDAYLATFNSPTEAAS